MIPQLLFFISLSKNNIDFIQIYTVYPSNPSTFLSSAFSQSVGKLKFICLTLYLSASHKNFNLGHNLWNRWDRAFIFHMCIPCALCTFLSTKIFNLATFTMTFDLHFENFNLDHNFGTIHLGLPYFRCVFLVAIPFPQ